MKPSKKQYICIAVDGNWEHKTHIADVAIVDKQHVDAAIKKFYRVNRTVKLFELGPEVKFKIKAEIE